jgi:uncharacterized protein YbbC (DUF1343 family)
VPASMPINTGLDQLLQSPQRLRGKRVALLTNEASLTRTAQPSVRALRSAGINLVALLSPEHGFSASVVAGRQLADSVHAATGLPVFSLYGVNKRPTAEMLAGVDVLLFDLQDAGTRFYTFTTTLAYALEACAASGVQLLVLDRPNPLGGMMVEGPVLQPAFQSFVGHGALPIRYGLTIGELAQFYARAVGFEAHLEVVPMRGWRREMLFAATGLPWAAPSPNMPHAETALFYPGMGLVGEGASLSIGALTPLPFERVGAPDINGEHLAEHLNQLGLPGVSFRATSFMPTAAAYPHQNVLCSGVQLHILDVHVYRSVAVGLHMLCAFRDVIGMSLNWNAEHVDRLFGSDQPRLQIDAGIAAEEIIAGWDDGLRVFRETCAGVMLYE